MRALGPGGGGSRAASRRGSSAVAPNCASSRAERAGTAPFECAAAARIALRVGVGVGVGVSVGVRAVAGRAAREGACQRRDLGATVASAAGDEVEQLAKLVERRPRAVVGVGVG